MIKNIQINIESKVHGNGLHTIQDLAFATRSGEFIAIVGPSGAGKTTLLKIIGGLDQNVTGAVLANNNQPLSQLEHNRGFVFQEPRLMPWLTVQENIALVLEHSRDKLALIPDLLGEVGLSEFAHVYPGQLSGGMQRRVGLARAFIVEPDLLLLDEPFQSLDEPTANDLRALLLKLWTKTKPTVFFVTHHLREALALADRVIFVSARPATVILDHVVDLPRPRAIDSREITNLTHELSEQNPRLLSGYID